MSEYDLSFETSRDQFRDIIRTVYDMSMTSRETRHLFIPGPIPEVMVDALLRQQYAATGSTIISMNTVLGRVCKFSIFTNSTRDRFFFHKRWLLHTEADSMALGLMFGVFNNEGNTP